MTLLLLALLVSQKDAKWTPPALTGGKSFVVLAPDLLLKPPASLQKGVALPADAPRVTLHYYPGQDYAGKPWSVWGESLFSDGVYYSAIGDHLAPAGNAFVFAFDPKANTFTTLADLRATLGLPAGHYTPGKIHSRLDRGTDGAIYFATHRGSTKTTTDANHYKGDWVLRLDPKAARTSVVAHGPVPKHCVPVSAFDPKRGLFYGATQPGDNKGRPHFFALDVATKKVVHASDDGPARSIAVSPSTGRAYYTRTSDGRVVRYDAAKNAEAVLDLKTQIRAASAECNGRIHVCTQGNADAPTTLHTLDVKTEKLREVGPLAVGSQQYVTALAATRDGGFVYYVPGAHGSGDRDGSPVCRIDTTTGERSVVCFLADACRPHGVVPKGSYALALDEDGGRIFVTWNASRGGKNWDVCCLTVIELPKKGGRK